MKFKFGNIVKDLKDFYTSPFSSFRKLSFDYQPSQKLSFNRLLEFIIFNITNHIAGIILSFLLIVLLNLFRVPESIMITKVPFAETEEINKFISFLSIVIFGAICEEFAFRYFLIFKRYAFLISFVFYMISVLFFSRMAIIKMFSGNYLDWLGDKSSVLIISGLIALVLFIAFYCLTPRMVDKIALFWKKNVFLIAFLSSSYFAFMHTSLPLYTRNIPWIIAMIFPFLISGLTYSYIRLKGGMRYAILCHMVWNLIFNLNLIG